MGKALTKSQLIGAIADKNDLTKKAVEEILEELTELAYKGARNGFTIPWHWKVSVAKSESPNGPESPNWRSY